MKTLHLKVVEGRVTIVNDEQQELLERLTNSNDAHPLFVEQFRETTIPFFTKHDIDFTIYREIHFPHVLNDVRNCITDFKNGNYKTHMEFLNAIDKIINNTRI